jgi:arylsulfatase A-like enzyme
VNVKLCVNCIFLSFLLFLSINASAGALADAVLEDKPNIILIMVDDMGYSDLGCYGGEIRTPNIDNLAKNGLRFTQFYNTSRCCPTRASIMTGLYPHQVGLVVNGRSLTRDGITIAEALKPAGYQTGMVGKWHLSKTIQVKDNTLHQKWLDHQYDPKQPFGPIETYPVNRGFEKFYGVIWGVVNYFDPFSLVEGDKPVPTVPEDYYITDAKTEKSSEYIKDFNQKKNPFFLYIAFTAPHWPLHARAEEIERYKGRYNGGWDRLRKERYERMLSMGLVDHERYPLPPVQVRDKSWDELSKEEKAFESAKMETHAAMIDRVDQGIEKIIQTLKDCKEYENTVIFFLSDNGASPEIMYRPGYDRSSQTRDGRIIRYMGFDRPGPETTYACIGQPWSSACNTPFRYWKAQSFEGGNHTPFIVHWPEGLKAEQGSTTEQLGHVIDIMPTCLKLANAKYPEQYKGNTILPLEGKSLLPIVYGKEREGYNKLFFEHERGRAVRIDDWKLVASKHSPKKWELYDLTKDRTETTNLVEQYPDKVKSMIAEWQAWAKKVNLPNSE